METINHIITALFIFICGIFLFFTSVIVFIIFIGYKELRSGVYSVIIAATFSEIYLGFHSIMNAINGFADRTEVDTICKVDSALSIFFIQNWCFQNFSIMFFIYIRKLEKSSWTKYIQVMTFVISGLSVALVALSDSLGLSFLHTCFISQSNSYSVALVLGIMVCLFLIALLYNLWYWCWRDRSLDRNIINSYNYFILITSTAYFILAVNIGLTNFCGISIKEFNISVIFILGACQLYIGYFRWRIEYVQHVLKSGPTKSNIVNGFLLLLCMYRRPKFKDIKKVVNVKFINNLNDSENTIYSHISRDY
jgi:hypothetical protein